MTEALVVAAHVAEPALLGHQLQEQQQRLLAWWELYGRRDPAQKPWMFTAAGSWPQPGEQLAPYGIWIAEVMRCSAA